MRARLSRPRWLTAAMIVAIALMVVSTGFQRDIILVALSFAVCAGATDYASGYAGLRTLGPALSFGLGSYAHAVITQRGGSFILSLIATPLVVAAMGAGLCAAFVRGRRDISSWAVFGLAASIAVEQAARAATSVTGGSNGILVPRYFGGWYGAGAFAAFTVATTWLALAWLLQRSSGPRGATALLAHFEPDRLDTHGVSVMATRASVAGVHWGLSAVAGINFAAVTGAVDPSIFGIQNNLTILIACALFGERTIVGPALAAFLIVMAENLVGSFLIGWQTAILGLCLIVALLWRSRDMSGGRWRPWMRERA